MFTYHIGAFFIAFFYMMNKDTNSMNRQTINKDIQFTAIRSKLQNGLHGQHLAADIVSKHLKFHMTRNPSKALALSFHGGPGTGKYYVSTIIADSIFKKGMWSKYVHLISGNQKYPHKDNCSVYKVL